MEILLIFLGLILAIVIIVMWEIKPKKLRNKVHFYVTRDSDVSITPDSLILWMGKPNKVNNIWNNSYSYCTPLCAEQNFGCFGLHPSNFKNLKFEDEPVEVFLNLED